MAEQWEQQDYIPIFYGINDYELCANYMIKLAVHFGDIQRAEKYKKNLIWLFLIRKTYGGCAEWV